MQELDTLLQEKLDQLEAGTSLEQCLADLPEQEANLLKLVAAMHRVDFSTPEQDEITDQRAHVLSFAQQTLQAPPAPNGVSTPPALSLLDQIRAFLDRILSRREFAYGAVALLIMFACVFVFFTTISVSGILFNRNSVAEVPGMATSGNDPTIKQPEATQRVAGAPETNQPNATPQAPTSPTEIPFDVTGDFVPVSRNLPAVPNIDPKTAAVQVLHGTAQIQTGEDGAWVTVNQVGTLVAGQQIRTGEFSKVVLTFFDGSEVHLGANTMIFVEELDARAKGNGPRIIKLTQRAGETEHIVATRNEQGARYKITTPGGIGTAQGTKFSILVTKDLLTRFAVTEGEVEVNNLNSTVLVKPGQASLTIAGQKPSPAYFQINGAGEVSQIGLTWVIAGLSFQTNNHTLIIGNPQVGDLVRVEGYITGEGVNVAVRIILLRPAISNQFNLNGTIEAIGTGLWTVSGQAITVNAETEIFGDPQIGDNVYVSGVILPGGVLLARQITVVENLPGLPFAFTGIVQEIHANFWVISDRVISIGAQTVIGAEIVVGDLVNVRGQILEGDIWLARVIVAANGGATFEFTGTVQSMTPWQVSGIGFEIREWTVIDPNVQVGDLVRVRGVILSDGTWVAIRISSLLDFPPQTIVFIGFVNSINPWVVNGIPLVITEATVITGNIQVGMPVVVVIHLMEDGTWVVLQIRPVYLNFGFGCMLINGTVTSVTGNQVILNNWAPITLGDDVEVHGNIQANSVILFHSCVLFDGTIIIIRIIVIYQPIIIIIPNPPRNNGNGNDNG